MADGISRTTITRARAMAPGAQPARSSLHVVYPPALARVFPLGDEEVTAGRDPTLAGLVLDHGTISRRHAAISWSPRRGAHAIRDLASRNGTWADGVRATEDERPLVDGSLLRLGDALLVYEQDPLPADVDGAEVSRDAVPGKAAPIRHLRALMARAAADPAAVLIVGPTGTGKERIARELHRLTGRTGRLVALNCSALSAPIVESQLFGHVKGAFTGASDAQPGLFRAAHGGTLFLDEIGDLPLELQPKLLRALQEGEVLPVGATQPVPVDVRVVAATHRDLARAMAAGEFREDLYARLSIWELTVPPLRARRVDLLAWIDRLYAEWTAKRQGGPPLELDADAAETLLRFGWPLNLRGLERLVHELAAGAAATTTITRAALPSWLTGEGEAPSPAPSPETPRAAPPERPEVPTREAFTRAFEELGGSVHALSKHFGRDRRQIYRWLEAHGLSEIRAKRVGPGSR
jgi:transcriptional regulator with PAS, ATPase and Fis domain